MNISFVSKDFVSCFSGKASLMTTHKDKSFQLIKEEQLFCTDFFYYGKSVPFVLTFVCQHPQWGYPMCFDLKADPNIYFNLSIKELKKELDKKPKVIRTIKHKKHPIIMNPSYGVNFDNYKQLDIKKLKQRAKSVRENKEFAKKIATILDEDASERKELDKVEILFKVCLNLCKVVKHKILKY